MIAELLLASTLGALALATALAIRRSVSQGWMPGLRDAVASPARGLRRVMRLPPTTTARPRVVVQGPKVKPLVCQICLGRVKEGLEHARCHCGKVFHPVCLTRTGFCPYCDRPYPTTIPEELMVRPPRPKEQSARRTADVRMLWEPTETRSCPMCGQEMERGSGECPCGAIIIEEGETFACPSCGTEVPPEMMQCPGCRERFDALHWPLCAVCGRAVLSRDGVCECGCLAGDECPECGAPLGPEDVECPSCGTAFELV